MRRQRTMRVAAGLAVFFGLAGCQKFLGFEEFQEGASGGVGAAAGSGGSATGGASGSGGDGGTDSGTPCTAAGVPANMVPVKRGDGSCFWIDKLEVTRGQYADFVKDPPTTPPICTWNTSLDAPENPVGTCASSADAGAAGAGGAGGGDTLPVTCVDWCDAYTYCVKQGKTLCKGSKGQAKTTDWYLACSGGFGVDNSWPYGKQHADGYCNDGCTSSCQLEPVGSFSDCKTTDPANEIFDLSGNASEWTDECVNTNVDPEAACNTRGGTVVDLGNSTACDAVVSPPRKNGQPYVGFRCCWEPS